MEIGCTIALHSVNVLLWLALSIAMITMGAMNIDNCPVERYIPIYMIVAGVFNLLLFVILPFKEKSHKIVILESVMGLFCFCWFIAGSVWVFRSYETYPGKCNRDLYLFAFWSLIVQYIALAILILVIFVMICCSVALVAVSSLWDPSCCSCAGGRRMATSSFSSRSITLLLLHWKKGVFWLSLLRIHYTAYAV